METEEQEVLLMILLVLGVVINVICLQTENIATAAEAACVRETIPKICNFMEVTVPAMLPDEFKRYFRMGPQTMDKLVRLLIQNPRLQTRQTCVSVDPVRKVYMTAFYLGQADPTFRCAHLFNVAEETFIRCVDEVMEALIDNISTFIRWPEKEDYENIASQFDKIGRWFPNVLGCLDGCQLRYQVGQSLNQIYYNGHKKIHSINLMAIATFNLAFIDIFAGWPGKSHDVFANSPIYKRIRHIMTFPARRLAETFSILADKAFPLCQQIMTPYKPPQGETLTPEQSEFNANMNSKRQTVERAFSLLKRRFRRLQLLNQRSHERAVTVVTAACILHNICIMESDNVDFFMNEPLIDDEQLAHVEGADPGIDNPANHTAGQLKRDLLKDAVIQYNMTH